MSLTPLATSRALGENYSSNAGTRERRVSGRVYTPEPLVEFVLDLCGFDGSPGVVLDPACGAGFFLLGAVDRIAAKMRPGSGWTASTRKAFVKQIRESVFGIDIDPGACAVARESLASLVQAHVHPVRVTGDMFSNNVACADFLLPGTQAGPMQASFVIGNPPYVTTSRLSAEYKDLLRAAFETASGRLDLYTLFIEAGLRRLRDGGKLAFITPNKYLLSSSAGPLRRLALANFSLRAIANFESHQVFEKAATVPCVTVLENTSRRRPVDVMRCEMSRTTRATRVTVSERGQVPPDQFRDGPWHAALSPHLREIAARLRAERPPLGQLTRRISAGLATGRDAVFTLSDEEAANIEPDLLRRPIRGRDIQRSAIAKTDRQLLLPYSFERATPELVPLSRYPQAYRYLRRYKEELQQRHCVKAWGKKWFDVHDPVPADIILPGRILVPDVAESNRFAVEDGNRVALHSAYYILPIELDPYFLTALLNSRPLEFLIRLEAPVVKDGFSRYRKQFLETLPIPITTAKMARDVAEAARANDQRRLDQLLAQAWALSDSDLKAIESFLERRARLLDSQAPPG